MQVTLTSQQTLSPRNVEVSMRDFEKLIGAAKLGHDADARAIAISHPEIINQRDETGATALHYAAFGGHRKLSRP